MKSKKGSQVWIAGVAPKARQKPYLKIIHQYLASPGGVTPKQLKTDLMATLQNTGFIAEDCLLTSYFYLLLKDEKSAHYYFKLAQTGDENTADLQRLQQRLNQTQQSYLHFDPDAKTSKQKNKYQTWVQDKLENALFDILQDTIHTPRYQPRFLPGEQQIFMGKYTQTLQRQIQKLQENIQALKLKSPLIQEKLRWLKAILQRYKQLERSMDRFNKAADQLEGKIKHTQNMHQKKGINTKGPALHLLKMEFQDHLAHMEDQLDLLDKLGYTVAPFYNCFTELNNRAVSLLTQSLRTA